MGPPGKFVFRDYVQQPFCDLRFLIKLGQEIEARVIKVDKAERRIGLSVKAANYSEEDIKREAAAFDSLKPGEDMVGLDQAFASALEDYRPGQK